MNSQAGSRQFSVEAWAVENLIACFSSSVGTRFKLEHSAVEGVAIRRAFGDRFLK